MRNHALSSACRFCDHVLPHIGAHGLSGIKEITFYWRNCGQGAWGVDGSEDLDTRPGSSTFSRPCLSGPQFLSFLFSICIYLFIWPHQVLAVARGVAHLRVIFSCGIHAFSSNVWDLVPWSGSEPGPPALGEQSLSYWITREVPWASVSSCIKTEHWGMYYWSRQ